MNGGAVILADEPTGALDKASGEQVMRILQELHADGHTIILVTHDMAVAAHASRVIEISDGAIIADRRSAPHESKDRKSTRLNSSHLVISYAVFCLKKKKT